jgi:hypothetical protein
MLAGTTRGGETVAGWMLTSVILLSPKAVTYNINLDSNYVVDDHFPEIALSLMVTACSS